MNLVKVMWKDHSDKDLVNLVETYKIDVSAKLKTGFLTNRREVELALTNFEFTYFKKKC